MNLEDAVQACDDLMVETVASDVSVLEDTSRHIIAAGGKRIRPRLLFLAYQAVGGIDLAGAVPLATAVELLHTATLVHDDINDRGQVRRGRETINGRWGQTFALLTGDYLFTKIYTLMIPYGDLNKVLAEAAVALVEGETLQAVAARSDTLSREVYQQIVAKKTASLFRAAALLGAQWGRGTDKHVEALGDYGFFLGLAFQIVDDLLDLTGDSQIMGKETGVDIGQGKGVATVYVQSGLGGNGRSTGGVGVASPTVLQEDQEDEDPYLRIKRQLIAGGAVDEGRQMALALATQSYSALECIPPSPAVEQLYNLVTLVLERDR
ncbi:MAG: polyprenyl synthetase family protein [Anaerolineae bacterium]|nr:polyprenyl synthetase family protein [Anaerolineae bacterium]